MARKTIRDIEHMTRSLASALNLPDDALRVSGAYGGHKIDIETCSLRRAYTAFDGTERAESVGCGTSDFLETGFVSTGALYAAVNAALSAVGSALAGKTLRASQDAGERTFCTRQDVQFYENACERARTQPDSATAAHLCLSARERLANAKVL